MDEKTRALLLEAAGLLTLIARGVVVPNLREQATELVEKIGGVLSSE